MLCQDWANTEAAYRFLDNDRVSQAEIFAGHFHATRDRAAATSGQIVFIHERTDSYKRDDVRAIGRLRSVLQVSIATESRDFIPPAAFGIALPLGWNHMLKEAAQILSDAKSCAVPGVLRTALIEQVGASARFE